MISRGKKRKLPCKRACGFGPCSKETFQNLGERHAELKRKMVSVGQAEMKKCADMINTRPFEPERVILTSFENRNLDFDMREPKEPKKGLC